jgi:hypothetical protein
MIDELRTVAYGFDYKVSKYEMYDVNGYRFRTRDHEDTRPNRRTTNTGVMTVCNKTEYYGVLEEIFELKWTRVVRKAPKAVIFKCHWFDPDHYRRPPGVGLVEINRERSLDCPDVYSVAQEATQVYYLSYPCKTDPNLLDYDVVYKVSPYGKLAMPIEQDYNPLINPNTYEGEFFQEEGGLTGHLVIDLTNMDIDGDDIDEEVEDPADLAFLDQLSAQNLNTAEESESSIDDTRDSDEEMTAPVADIRGQYDFPDPDDPDLEDYM